MTLLYSITFWGYCILLALNSVLYSILNLRQSKNKKKGTAIISIYLWSMLIIQVASDLASYISYNNLYFSHIYFYTQFFLIGIFYFQVLTSVRQRRFILSYIIFTTLLLIIQYLVVPDLLFRFSLVEVFFTNYLLVCCALMYHYNLLSAKSERKFSIFNFGILTYSVLSLSFFLFGNVMSKINIDISIYVWLIHSIVLVFFHVMILVQCIKLFSLKE